MDIKFLEIALKEAMKSFSRDEVPVGCVIVKDGKVIAKAHNKREKNNSVISHAEILAILKASRKVRDWQLKDCDVYITLEPCAMCGSALIQARVKNIYFGCKSNKEGSLGSCINLLEAKNLNHKPNCSCLDNEECSKILIDYFKNKREIK